ncbi:hypothetical protein TUMEXPCC7403_01515 [Tumidithrix helvetica PCC 7403]|uniref:serine/threonine protein kinase n=1 Tax=Tumidithrix helvetica TaxID=3457545 RepID=UPI003CAD3154
MNSSSQSDAWIGQFVGDRQRYRIDKNLGGGGMGDVYLAMDTLLGKQVALKLLKGSLVNAEGFFKRFEREVAVCAALKSDHIVGITDYGLVSGGYPFYVMEYLQGQTLRQKLDRDKQLSPKQTVNIISQVCRGLKVAHDGVTLWKNNASESETIKVVHRDLKPDNIFLVPSSLGELAKIIDFGVVKLCTESQNDESILTVQKSIIGTLRYAAPEQLEGLSTVDSRADIYSLGVILYEMLTGVDPFGFLSPSRRGATSASWIVAHTTKPPNPFQGLVGCEHIPPALEAVVMKCLQKLPADRFDSVDKLEQALKAAIHLVGADDTIAIGSLQTEGDIYDSATITSIPRKPATLATFVDTPTNQQLTNSEAPTLVKSSTTPELEPTLVNAEVRPEVNTGSWHQTDRETAVTPKPKHRLPLILTGVLMVIVAAIAGSVYFYSQNKEREILDTVKSLQSQKKYLKCIIETQKVEQNAKIYVDVQEVLHQCRLGHAKFLATENKLIEAFAFLESIPASSSIFPEAQKLLGQWSEKTIASATEKYQAGNPKEAIAQVQAIPPNSPTYVKSQATIKQWQSDWQLAEKQFNAAQTALKNNSPQEAIDAANKIPKIAFWQSKVKPIVESARSQMGTPTNTSPKTPGNTQGSTTVEPVTPPTESVTPPTEPVTPPTEPIVPPSAPGWEDQGGGKKDTSI